jgi:hypothetical protein
MLDFLTLQTTTSHPSLFSILYTVLLSFLLSSAIALTYEKTFRGLSYSRNYLQALILGSIVAGTVMQAIGDNPVRGFGVLGALAIIRFRTVFKDPRDIIFMFAGIASGISCGVFGYGIAALGTLGFCAAAFALYYSSFGKNRYFDGMLRFSLETASSGPASFELTMKEFCKNFALISLREAAQGKRLDYAYHIKLKSGKTNEAFVKRLSGLESIKDLQLLLQETTVEL